MAEARNVNGIPINDGGGLMDTNGLIDSLIVDTNGLMKSLVNGQYVGFAGTIVAMVQKLSTLQSGVKAEKAGYESQIRDLQKLNAELIRETAGRQLESGVEHGQDQV